MTAAKVLGRVVFGVLVIVATGSAYGDSSGSYADFDLGVAKYSYATEVKFPAATLSAADPSIKNTSWGLNVGYRFMPYFGAEVGYVSLGKASLPAAGTASGGAAHGTANFDSKGPTLALVGAIQLRDFEIFVKLGYLFAHAELSVAGINGSTKLNTRLTASTPAPLAGAGIRYAFNDHWHVKLEYDHYDGIGDAQTSGATSISATTLGIGCRF